MGSKCSLFWILLKSFELKVLQFKEIIIRQFLIKLKMELLEWMVFDQSFRSD